MPKKTLIALALLHALPTLADTLAPIEIKAETFTANTQQPAQLTETTGTADSGDLLRKLNGVEGSRMGGHGIDPVIHGQKASRVQVRLDGAEIASGCPNRMDPATIYGDLDSFDVLEARQGVTTLTQPVENASGGALILKRKLPTQSGTHGRLSLSKSSLVDYGANLDVAHREDKAAIRAFANRTEAQNYQDGNGDTVKARYSHLGYGVLGGIQLNDNSLLRLSAERSRTEDALYPGAKMDSPYTEGNIVRADYTHRFASAKLSAVNLNAYRSTVDHLMDNYTYRNTNPMMWRRTPTSTETVGGGLTLKSQFGPAALTYGWDSRYEKKLATFENAKTNTALSLMWPDTRIQRNSLFAQMVHPFAKGTLTLGVRQDWLHTDAKKADTVVNGSTAHALYDATYKTPATIKQDDSLTHALVKWQQPMGLWKTSLNLAHTGRAPSATERYIAKNAGQNSWVGNPNLKPEYHNQLTLSASGNGLGAYVQASVWKDWVDNYILKDFAKNQPQFAKTSDNRIIYVNKTAELQGATVSADWPLTSKLDMLVEANYTEGRNTADHRNLAGIPPLNGKVQFEYAAAKTRYGARINWAADKTAIDAASPDETGKTSGWATLDLYTRVQLHRHVHLSAGVDNVFDHAYADYLNRKMDPTQGTSYQVNEPGRTFYAKITAKF